jgi:mono/diheme cytochrome c family protein
MRKIRANTQSLGVAGAAALTILFAGSPAMAAESDPQDYTQIERGRYLAVASDCSSCHTVPGSDRPFAGGRPIETPFGNIVAPNITPDRDTGIGAWSDDEFERAVRKGVRRGGWLLYPAMPYNAFTKMSRDDVLAIRAYLNTVTPASNAVVANTLPFPFNIRAAMRVWNALYFTEGEYTPDQAPKPLPSDDPVMAAGGAIYRDQCSACHGLDGRGVPLLFPSLADSSMARSDDPTTLIRIVLRGARSVATAAEPTAPGMPSYGWQLDDGQVAAVLTYVRNTWGAAASAVSAQVVGRARSDLASRVD